MTKLLIDTCIWLDLANDPNQQVLLPVIEELIEINAVELLVPQIVLDEFERNKTRIVETSRRSLVGTVKRVKDVISKFGEDANKGDILSYLNDIAHKVPLMEEYAAQGSSNWLSTLLEQSTILPISEEAMLAAAQRAISKKAPFHRNKNSIADAVIIETYATLVRESKERGTNFAFVTSNISDFSDPNGNQKSPHPDFASFFSARKSRFYVNLAEALHSIKPKLVPEMLTYHKEILGEPRSLATLLTVEDELSRKIWYNRHQVTKEGIDEGKISIIERDSSDLYNSRTTIYADIWEGAKQSARRLEESMGLENLGPWDNFEWGMLNGKLSAIRWFLGEEWDSLYT